MKPTDLTSYPDNPPLGENEKSAQHEIAEKAAGDRKDLAERWNKA